MSTSFKDFKIFVTWSHILQEETCRIFIPASTFDFAPI